MHVKREIGEPVGVVGRRSVGAEQCGTRGTPMRSEQLLQLSPWCTLQASTSCVTSSRCERG